MEILRQPPLPLVLEIPGALPDEQYDVVIANNQTEFAAFIRSDVDGLLKVVLPVYPFMLRFPRTVMPPSTHRLPKFVPGRLTEMPNQQSSSIAQRFEQLKQDGRLALMPFLMAGDPDLAVTADVLLSLQSAGADMVELGMPYSDPLADGPVIQAAASRALAAGTTPTGVLDMLRSLKGQLQIPVILFTYSNPLLNGGMEAFCQSAAEAGAAGLVVPDLPLEEAERLSTIAERHGLDLVLLVAPTTPQDRMGRIATCSRGFTYLVSVTGVTGERAQMESRVEGLVQQLKQTSPVPVAVGFLGGAEMLGGLLAGVTTCGVLMAIFQSNAGGAWDNAKKMIESEGRKGTDAHKAAVVGDTVGDPFKDTSGPSMNILIKLTCLIGLVVAPILGGHASHSDHSTSNIEVKKEVIVKVDGDDWAMTVTTNENDNGEVTSSTETLTGTQEEVMSALKQHNVDEIKEIAIGAMGQIDKK